MVWTCKAQHRLDCRSTQVECGCTEKIWQAKEIMGWSAWEWQKEARYGFCWPSKSFWVERTPSRKTCQKAQPLVRGKLGSKMDMMMMIIFICRFESSLKHSFTQDAPKMKEKSFPIVLYGYWKNVHAYPFNSVRDMVLCLKLPHMCQQRHLQQQHVPSLSVYVNIFPLHPSSTPCSSDCRESERRIVSIGHFHHVWPWSRHFIRRRLRPAFPES